MNIQIVSSDLFVVNLLVKPNSTVKQIVQIYSNAMGLQESSPVVWTDFGVEMHEPQQNITIQELVQMQKKYFNVKILSLRIGVEARNCFASFQSAHVICTVSEWIVQKLQLKNVPIALSVLKNSIDFLNSKDGVVQGPGSIFATPERVSDQFQTFQKYFGSLPWGIPVLQSIGYQTNGEYFELRRDCANMDVVRSLERFLKFAVDAQSFSSSEGSQLSLMLDDESKDARDLMRRDEALARSLQEAERRKVLRRVDDRASSMLSLSRSSTQPVTAFHSARRVSSLPSPRRSSFSCFPPVESVDKYSYLPTVKVTSLSEHQEPCSICMESFVVGDVLRKTPCLHAFHRRCIDKWLDVKSHCPLCRTGLDSASEIPTSGSGYFVGVRRGSLSL